MKKIRVITLFAVLVTFFANCTNPELSHPTVQSTLWVQNSAEFDALNLQAYRTAETYLQKAIDDKNWYAAIEQDGQDVSELPPAIILDIDETILDNSPFQARMIEQNSDFDIDEWNKWSLEGQADAIAGSVSLTQKAAELGITVFYITNREALTKEATRENMENLGFALSDEIDTIMLVGEKENWTSAKIERRNVIAADYRIIMLFGDDLNDFLPAKNMTQEERDDLVFNNIENWGTKWFVLPNPNYGSWEQALTNFDNSLTEEEVQKMRKSRLNTKQ